MHCGARFNQRAEERRQSRTRPRLELINELLFNSFEPRRLRRARRILIAMLVIVSDFSREAVDEISVDRGRSAVDRSIWCCGRDIPDRDRVACRKCVFERLVELLFELFFRSFRFTGHCRPPD
jgi:hypothetical protein